MIDLGTGPPLVLVPGIQGRWEWMWPAVRALARTHRVISFSLCGDRGSHFPFDRARGFSNFVAHLDDVLDRARLETVSLVGHSFGGLIALRYAAERPHRTTALVLVSTPSPAWRPDERMRKYMAAPYLSAPLFVAGSPGRLWPEIVAAHANLATRARFAATHLARVASAPFSPGLMRARLICQAEVDLVSDCARVAAPTLVITGEPALDRVVPVDGTREFLQLIPGARAAVLERTGHIGLVTRPEAFAEIIETFLRR